MAGSHHRLAIGWQYSTCSRFVGGVPAVVNMLKLLIWFVICVLADLRCTTAGRRAMPNSHLTLALGLSSPGALYAFPWKSVATFGFGCYASFYVSSTFASTETEVAGGLARKPMIGSHRWPTLFL